MLGFKPKKPDVLSHWYSLVPGFSTSTQDFYAGIEQELKSRQIPGLEISRVEFSEGGPLSANRQYLRMTRERLVFDVCAAPFGTGFFFSCRFAEIPLKVNPIALLVAFIAADLIFGMLYIPLAKFLGDFLGLLALLLLICAVVYVLRNTVALGLKDLDATLLKSPLVGPVYERFFRKETYFRQDTRLMYCDVVNEVVKAKVEEVTGAKGIKLIRFNEHNPILEELYKPRQVTLPKSPPT